MRVDTAPASTPSSPPMPSPSGVHLTEAQFQQWMNLQNYVHLQGAVAARTAVTPRVGGISAHGVWTGLGKNEEGLKPVSDMAFRELFATGLKAFSHQGTLDHPCRAGLPSVTGAPLFSQAHEADGSKLVPCLQALKRFLRAHGMEGVFKIVRPNAKEVNMLTPTDT